MARIGIIGTGWGARVQVPAFREAGLDVVAIAGHDPERTGRVAGQLDIESFEPPEDFRKDALLSDPAVTAVAEALDRTPAQVLIRWHLQLGNIVIPKSVNPERIASNFGVFDFELSENDIASISSLDDGHRLGPDPRTFDFTGR